MAKQLSEEDLQIPEERRKMKGKEERERYAEFQRIASRDKKDSLNEHCKEIEENNREGKTRDLFKKTEAIKGTFNARMGAIKDRNSKDLTEAEDAARIHRRTVQKKVLMTWITMMVWSLTQSQTSWK